MSHALAPRVAALLIAACAAVALADAKSPDKQFEVMFTTLTRDSKPDPHLIVVAAKDADAAKAKVRKQYKVLEFRWVREIVSEK